MDRPFPPGCYTCAWKKPAIFSLAGRNWAPGSGNTLVEEERPRSASAPDGEETRLALAAAAVAVSLGQIREPRAQVCSLPRISAQRSPPPRT
jgi:hypothetical protein